MYVIVTANILDGFRIIAPFPNEHDADEWARTLLDPTVSYTIMEVEPIE